MITQPGLLYMTLVISSISLCLHRRENSQFFLSYFYISEWLGHNYPTDLLGGTFHNQLQLIVMIHSTHILSWKSSRVHIWPLVTNTQNNHLWDSNLWVCNGRYLSAWRPDGHFIKIKEEGNEKMCSQMSSHPLRATWGSTLELTSVFKPDIHSHSWVVWSLPCVV